MKKRTHNAIELQAWYFLYLLLPFWHHFEIIDENDVRHKIKSILITILIDVICKLWSCTF